MTIVAKKTNGKGVNYTSLRLKRVKTYGMKQACVIPVSHKPHSGGYTYLVPRDVKEAQANACTVWST